MKTGAKIAIGILAAAAATGVVLYARKNKLTSGGANPPTAASLVDDGGGENQSQFLDNYKNLLEIVKPKPTVSTYTPPASTYVPPVQLKPEIKQNIIAPIVQMPAPTPEQPQIVIQASRLVPQITVEADPVTNQYKIIDVAPTTRPQIIDQRNDEYSNAIVTYGPSGSVVSYYEGNDIDPEASRVKFHLEGFRKRKSLRGVGFQLLS